MVPVEWRSTARLLVKPAAEQSMNRHLPGLAPNRQSHDKQPPPNIEDWALSVGRCSCRHGQLHDTVASRGDAFVT